MENCGFEADAFIPPKTEQVVERSQEYRTALITVAVAGRIDVHGSVAIPSEIQVAFASR